MHPRGQAPGPNDRSLGQSGSSQAFYVPGKIFRPTKRHNVIEIGDTQTGVDLAQACHSLLSIREPAGKCVASRGHAKTGKIIWVASQHLFSP